MFGAFYHAVFYNPIYNGLVFLISVVPGADVGLAIIAITLVVRLLLFPLSLEAVRTQIMMKELEPELARIKEDYKDNREEQARRTMQLYRDKKVNPFSTILFAVIQLLFIIALYLIFSRSGLPSLHPEYLYSFVHLPSDVNTMFLGLLDVTKKNLPLAVLAGAVQFIQTRLSMPPSKPKPGATPSFKDDLAKSMQLQMRYGLPVIVLIASYVTSAVIALYFLVSNIVSIGQELYVRARIKRS